MPDGMVDPTGPLRISNTIISREQESLKLSNNPHGLTNTGQYKIGKTSTGLVSLDFCCHVQMVGSEFVANNGKT